jgi:hypothetical protein
MPIDMRDPDLRHAVPLNDDRQRPRWQWLFLTFCTLTVLVAFLLNRRQNDTDRAR